MHLNLILPYPSLLQPLLYWPTTLARVFYRPHLTAEATPCSKRQQLNHFCLAILHAAETCDMWLWRFFFDSCCYPFLLLVHPFSSGCSRPRNLLLWFCYIEQVDSYGCSSHTSTAINPRPYGRWPMAQVQSTGSSPVQNIFWVSLRQELKEALKAGELGLLRDPTLQCCSYMQLSSLDNETWIVFDLDSDRSCWINTPPQDKSYSWDDVLEFTPSLRFSFVNLNVWKLNSIPKLHQRDPQELWSWCL